MKNIPHPDRTAEAASVRDELSHQPEVQRSLDALAREENSEVSIPPIPDELREQWQDRFGVARQPVIAEKPSWLSKISQLWLYGGATALAAIAILVALKNDPTSPAPDAPPVMRGGGQFSPLKDTPVVLIPSDTIPFDAFADTRQEGLAFEAADLASATALLQEKQLKSAVILEAATGKLYPWNGELMDAVNFYEISTTTDELDLSEALDEYLKE